MKRKDIFPRITEFGEDPGARGGGGGSGKIFDTRGTAENPRARMGGNKPPVEDVLVKEKPTGRLKGTSGNFTLKAEPRSTPKGGRVTKGQDLAAPAVQTKGDASMVEKIFQHAEQHRTPDYPMAKEPVFAPADADLTKQLVPQRSIADRLPPMPSADNLPANSRSLPILENTQAIGEKLAGDLAKAGGGEMPFYSTGTVLQGLQDRAGMSPTEANKLIYDWAGQGAATSPRTKTPTNLRNASYLMYERAQGNPLTPSRQQAEQDQALWGFNKKGDPNLNRPGFPMLGMHTQMADDFATGTFDPWSHPKPGTFRENWSGNMADVTADTHNIRAIVDAYDQLAPGTLPRGWFTNQPAYDAYVANKGFPKTGQLPVGDIKDTLEGQMIPGAGPGGASKYAQTEYPVISGPTRVAAEKLGISPAEAQERLWFLKGPRTGLQSPSMTIPDLFNAQIEATAKVLGLSPDAVMRMWSQRRIPFAQNEPQNVPGESAVG